MCGKINFKTKRYVLKILLYVFTRSMVFLSRKDFKFMKEIRSLPDGFNFCMKVKGDEFCVCMVKRNGSLEVAEAKDTADLELIFVDLCSAFLTFSGLLSQYDAFSQNRIMIKGDIGNAIALTNAIRRLQVVVFPYFISKRLVKGRLKKDFEDGLQMIKTYFFVISFKK